MTAARVPYLGFLCGAGRLLDGVLRRFRCAGNYPF